MRILKKIANILTSRLIIIGLLILMQMAWFVILTSRLSLYAHWVDVVLTVCSVLIELYIIRHDGNPSYKILWLLFIGLLPVLGSLMYLFFGDKRSSFRMWRCLHHGCHVIGSCVPRDSVVGQISSRAGGLANMLESLDFPMYKNTQVKYYPLGDEMFPDLIRDLESAEHYIFMEYFIVSDGVMWESVKTILKEKAAQGLDVRLVYDDLGSISCIPKQFARDLREASVKVMVFNPFRPVLFAGINNRNHRKITVVDGYIAYTGGLNLADEYINQKERFGHWKDTAVRIYGDAAFSFTKMCLELWNAFYKTNDHCSQYLPHIYHPEPFLSDGFVQPYCNSPFEDENLAQRVYLDMLYQAKQYVYIFTPYLAIDNEMQNALCAAAKRGVDVRIVTPGIPDKRVVHSLTRSYYESLLYAGVCIYEYTPGFIHAKSYLVDGYMGIVGTINMDYRGLYLHMEDAVFMVGCSALEELKLDCIVTLEQSHRVTLQECKRRHHNLLWQAFLRTISPLL